VVRCARAEYLAPVDPPRAHDDARWAQRVFVEAGDVVFVPAKGAFNFEALTRDLLLLTGLLR
jgi:hypothetical protein